MIHGIAYMLGVMKKCNRNKKSKFKKTIGCSTIKKNTLIYPFSTEIWEAGIGNNFHVANPYHLCKMENVYARV